MGQRRLINKGVKPPEIGTHNTVTEEDYTIHRIVRGVPEGSREIIPGASFPMEANLDVMGGGTFSTLVSTTGPITRYLRAGSSRLQERLLHWPRAYGSDLSHRLDQKTHLPSRVTRIQQTS
jgi:hypothetical protein